MATEKDIRDVQKALEDAKEAAAQLEQKIQSIGPAARGTATVLGEFAQTTRTVSEEFKKYSSIIDNLNTGYLNLIGSSDKAGKGLLSLFGIMKAHPVAALVTVIMTLVTAIGVHLHREALKAREAFEQAELERIFGGIAVTADDLATYLQPMAGHLDKTATSLSGYNSEIKNLQEEYDKVVESMSLLMDQTLLTNGQIEGSVDELCTKLTDMGTIVLESVDLTTQQTYKMLTDLFTNTDGTVGKHESEILGRLLSLDSRVKTEILSILGEISTIHQGLGEDAITDMSFYASEEFRLLQSYSDRLDEYMDIKRNSQVKRQKLESAQVYKDICDGILVVDHASHKELLDQHASNGRDLLNLANDNYRERINMLQETVDLEAWLTHEGSESHIAAMKDMEDSLAGLTEAYREEQKEIYATQAATLMMAQTKIVEHRAAYDEVAKLLQRENDIIEARQKLSDDDSLGLETQLALLDAYDKNLEYVQRQMENHPLYNGEDLTAWMNYEQYSQLREVHEAIGDAIGEQRTLYEALDDTAGAFDASVAQVTAGVLENVGLLNGEISEEWQAMIDEALESGAEIVQAVGEGMGEAQPDVLASASEVKDNVLEVLDEGVDSAADIGSEYARATGQGMEGASSEVEQSAQTVVEAAQNTIDDSIVETGETIPQGMATGVEAATPEAVAAVDEMAAHVQKELEETLGIDAEGSQVMIEYGQAMVQGLITGLNNTLEDATSTVETLCEAIKTTIEDSFEIDGEASEWFTRTAGIMTASYNQAIEDNMEEDITTPTADLSEEIQTVLSDAFEIDGDTSGWFQNTGKIMVTSMADAITDNTPTIVASFKAMFNEIGGGVENFLNGIVDAWYQTVKEMAVLARKVGSSFSVSKPSRISIPSFAGGGFVPTSADLFLANENGVPEMVGRIGNRAAVANNDQIVAAISRGVYEATVAASRNQQVNVAVSGEFRQHGSDLIAVIDTANRISGKPAAATLSW